MSILYWMPHHVLRQNEMHVFILIEVYLIVEKYLKLIYSTCVSMEMSTKGSQIGEYKKVSPKKKTKTPK